MSSTSIFDIQKSNQDTEFVLKNGDLEIDVLADIIETSANIPFVGSLIKLCKVGINLMDLHYVRKLAKFLKESEEIPSKKKEAFLNSLDKEDYKRISETLSHLLYQAESDEKAILMGKLYRYRVENKIDNDNLLRLTLIVSKSYVGDLYHLQDYYKVNESDDFVSASLNALGLLKDCGNMYEVQRDGFESTGFGTTKHSLNEKGLLLFNIINNSEIEDYNKYLEIVEKS